MKDIGALLRFMFLVLASLLLPIASHAEEAPSADEDWVYSVREGDTLWDLCEKYTSRPKCWLELGPYNRVKFPKALKPATRIRFPIAWLKLPPLNAVVVQVRGAANLYNSHQDYAKSAFHKGADNKPVEPKGLNTGSRVASGQVIEVEDSSKALLRFDDNSMLEIDENSAVVLLSSQRVAAAREIDSKIELLYGGVSVKVPKVEPRSRFQVSTPSAVAAVRGTEFRIDHRLESAKPTLGAVYEGGIAVSTEVGGEVDVNRGEGVVVAADGKMKTKTLLPAVVFRTSDAEIDLHHFLEWKPMMYAESYTASFVNREDKQFLMSRTTSQLKIPASDIGIGCYYVTVQALDRDGLAGMKSEKELCVIEPVEKSRDIRGLVVGVLMALGALLLL